MASLLGFFYDKRIREDNSGQGWGMLCNKWGLKSTVYEYVYVFTLHNFNSRACFIMDIHSQTLANTFLHLKNVYSLTTFLTKYMCRQVNRMN